MENYYSIAGHLVCIVCESPTVMLALSEFEAFQVSGSESESGNTDIIVTLQEDTPQSVQGTLYHTLVTDVAVSRFYNSAEVSGMEIWQCERLQLTMRFKHGSQECFIQGNLSPLLLRFALWAAFNIAVIGRQTVAIHASAVIYQGRAFLFLGESGTGKSTHTRLICQHYPQAELLNDDSPILRIEHDRCMVYGSPWSGKTSCYRQCKAPLGGVVRLHQSVVNKISRLPVHQAIGALLPSFPPELYLCYGSQSKVLAIISEIIEQAPVYSLQCLPDKEAAEMSVETITKSL
ncbi:hypothetical protein [uncultured Bacteroides sp.]|uniref:hypothetical protein n=1 Tax=uncultured Bacteroides sp. TaxID=162156 RepID=UPI002AA85DC1|nr:hypothetical protein [uncultured Bacteroides sp.]